MKLQPIHRPLRFLWGRVSEWGYRASSVDEGRCKVAGRGITRELVIMDLLFAISELMVLLWGLLWSQHVS